MNARATRAALAALLAVGGLSAPAADAEPAAPLDEPAPSPSSATPPALDLDRLDDDALIELARTQGEIVELWDERPDKPFDRDTEVRLTGEELAARGATDLAGALDLLPDVNVRDAGRGGFIIDIRGARKGAVRILIDGVSVSDPYYGTFDVSTIPITDIVQIRVATAPASPIDGPGGPGGVIEVHTRDAAGPRLVVTRVRGDSLPSLSASATGRTALRPDLWLRLSTTALLGMQEFELPSTARLDEHRKATTGGLRLEYRRGDRRVALDGFVDDRHYLPPPNDESATAAILVIDRETTGRLQAAFDERRGKLQLQARAWTHAMARRSRYFRDPEMTELVTGEDLSAVRIGGTALATRPIVPSTRWVASLTVDHERARVEATQSATVSRGDVTVIEPAAGLQFERGRVRVDGAAGVAVPLGLGAEPWPEAKLVGRWRPVDLVELVATVGRKGRTPSLRERFDAVTGNPALGPELASHAELRAIVRPADGVELQAAPYYRRATGTPRSSATSPRLANLGTVDVRGADLIARVRLAPAVEVGGSYQLTLDRARTDDGAAWTDDPLDRLPDHRADGWVRLSPLAALSSLARVR